jgi:phosphoribosylformimino-5-aminoimidazole carboxamide ribotide isomerase
MSFIVIPALDVLEGKCVRLLHGIYAQKTIYHDSPLEVAKRFADAGITRLHLVDLDGAKGEGIKNLKVLEEICEGTPLKVDFSGGIKREIDIRDAFGCGACQVGIGSVAVNDKALFLKWLKEFGSERIILSADARNKKVAVKGWEEESPIDLIDLLSEYQREGLSYSICTDITKDGTLSGPGISLYEEILKRTLKLKIIASGGIASMADIEALRDLKVNESKLYGVIIGKALYEGRILLSDIVS